MRVNTRVLVHGERVRIDAFQDVILSIWIVGSDEQFIEAGFNLNALVHWNPADVTLWLILGVLQQFSSHDCNFIILSSFNVGNLDWITILQTDNFSNSKAVEVAGVLQSDIASVNVELLGQSDRISASFWVFWEQKTLSLFLEISRNVFKDELHWVNNSHSSLSSLVKLLSQAVLEEIE